MQNQMQHSKSENRHSENANIEREIISKENFVATYRQLLLRSGKKQTDIIKATGISQTSISAMTNLKSGRMPTLNQAALLADYFGVTIDEVLGLAEKKDEKGSAPLENLSDIIRQLFRIYEALEFSFIDGVVVSHTTDGLIEEPVYASCLYFTNHKLDSIIKKWGGVSNSLKDDPAKNEFLGAWLDATARSEYIANSLKKYGFFTLEELAMDQVASADFFSGYDDGRSFGLFIEKLSDPELGRVHDLLEAERLKDVNYQDLEVATNLTAAEIQERRNEAFLNLPDVIDDELPFN